MENKSLQKRKNKSRKHIIYNSISYKKYNELKSENKRGTDLINATCKCVECYYRGAKNEDLIQAYVNICNQMKFSYNFMENIVFIIIAAAIPFVIDSIIEMCTLHIDGNIFNLIVHCIILIAIVFATVFIIQKLMKSLLSTLKNYDTEYDLIIEPFEKMCIISELKKRKILDENEIYIIKK